MKGKSKSPLNVALHGMDGRTYKTMVMFFQGPCKGTAVVVEALHAEIDIVDADLANSKELLDQCLERDPIRPIIVLSLQELDLENIIYVKKPIQTEVMLAALHRAKKQLSNPQQQTFEHPGEPLEDNSGSVKEVDESLADTETSDRKKITDDQLLEQKKTSKHQTAMELDEKRFSVFIGLLADIDFNDPEQLPLASYNAKDYFQGYVQSVYKVCRKQARALRLNSGWKPLFLLPQSNEIWLDANDKQLRAFAGIIVNSGSLEERKKMTLSPIDVKDDALGSDLQFFQDMDAFLWKLTCWTSKGRYPYKLDFNHPVILKRWPNFTRLMITPHALRIAALLIEGPRTFTNIAETLNIKHQYVFIFISAAYALDLVVQAERKADLVVQPAETQPSKRKGLLNRILNKLRTYHT